MKTVTVSEAKAHLSRILKQVEAGETLLILHRGRPVARLEPIRVERDLRVEARIERLERAGFLRRGAKPPDVAVLDQPAPRLSAERGLLAALLEERTEDR